MNLFWPGSLRRRAEFYQRLGQLTSAGIGVVPALEALREMPPHAAYRAPITALLASVTAGQTLTQALGGARFPEFDADLIYAGERSGRLDACLLLLREYYEGRARMGGQALRQLIYPVILLHVGVFIFGVLIPYVLSGFAANPFGLVGRAILTLAPFYLFGAALVIALEGSRGERWRAIIESTLHRVPMLGDGRNSLALARLAMALEALTAAGVSPREGWDIAARACGSPALRSVVASWSPHWERGITPTHLLRGSERFPVMFTNLYATGELSGTLEATLRRLHLHYQEEGARRLETFAKLLPRLFYILVALYVGFSLLRAYAGYFDLIEQIWKN